jgi:hypothetical protein
METMAVIDEDSDADNSSVLTLGNYVEWSEKCDHICGEKYGFLAKVFLENTKYQVPPVRVEDFTPQKSDEFTSDQINELRVDCEVARMRHVLEVKNLEPRMFWTLRARISDESMQIIMAHDDWDECLRDRSGSALAIIARDSHSVNVGVAELMEDRRYSLTVDMNALRQSRTETICKFKKRFDTLLTMMDGAGILAMSQQYLAVSFMRKLDVSRYAHFQFDLRNSAARGVAFPQTLALMYRLAAGCTRHPSTLTAADRASARGATMLTDDYMPMQADMVTADIQPTLTRSGTVSSSEYVHTAELTEVIRGSGDACNSHNVPKLVLEQTFQASHTSMTQKKIVRSGKTKTTSRSQAWRTGYRARDCPQVAPLDSSDASSSATTVEAHGNDLRRGSRVGRWRTECDNVHDACRGTTVSPSHGEGSEDHGVDKLSVTCQSVAQLPYDAKGHMMPRVDPTSQRCRLLAS